ncbi:carbohydrate ABC transporter permease [Paenibacillus nasutitermitis]|uniref:Sugar ABC transporter permease n=1 Tax=Paenibacillus nasutitermitis TaxID=1652958 RepID=A0A916ZLS8_9BACL|nr:sugar ABC transporter permease [Paenibacillus nasutitermitis]GGE03076.1 sugar ABC transporter permease [Paenibacillus nasutitermitis]
MIHRIDKAIRKNAVGYLFMLPLIVGIVVFSIYPMINAFILSMHRSASGTGGDWVGWANYEFVIADSSFWKSLYNTLYMGALSVLSGVVFSFILATLINNLVSTRLKNVFKAIFFLPNVVSAVATSIVFTFLFYPSREGLLNYFVGWLGMEPIGWFTDPTFAPLSIVLMNLWSALGYNTIIFIAGLQGVPGDLYEAADVDGATPLRKWFYITIPYMRSIFVFMIIIGIINSMKRFTDVWLIGGTAGNPGGSLLTSVLYIYRNAFLSSQMGVASAASYILFIFILLLTVIMLMFNRKKNSFD